MTLPHDSLVDPASMSPGELATHGLACRRGRRLLLRGLDMCLKPGTVTWLRGTNGSGKTSLLRILAGLSQAAEGHITWNGLPVKDAADVVRRSTIYIGHTNALKEDLTLTESVAFLATLADLSDPIDRAERALTQMGLASRRQATVRTLSQGQRRRGALARLALDESPRLWLLDEPLDALDSQSVDLLATLVEAHRSRGGSVLLTSHQAVTLAHTQVFDLEPWRVP